MKQKFKVVIVKQDATNLEKALNEGWTALQCAANEHCFVYILKKQ